MSQHEEQTIPTSRCKQAWIILFLTTVVGLVSDLWTKSWAFASLAHTPVIIHRDDVLQANQLGQLIPQHDPMVVIPSVLEFTLVLNPGAVFGIGAGQRWFFVVFTVLAIFISLILFLRWTRPQDWIAHSGFGLVIAGGLGNLYDRLQFACVRDFIHPLPGVQLPFGLSWPGGNTDVWPYVSNVADAYLIIGIVFLMIHAWRLPVHEDQEENESTESQESV